MTITRKAIATCRSTESRPRNLRRTQALGPPANSAPSWATFSRRRSATDFKYVQEDTIAHRAASVFDFKVQRVRSSWKIWVPGQYVLPAYKGSVWIDKQTGQVLRIEMQAKEIPEAFPEISG